MIKLNVGSGTDYREGWVNIDNRSNVMADIIMDIEKEKLPFANDSVDVIECNYVIEHLNDTEHLIREFHRVIKTTGIIKIGLPHHTASIAYHSDHRTYYRLYCFSEFDIDWGNRCFEDYPKFKFKRKLVFPYYHKPLQYICNFHITQMIYENTGLRFIFPADYILLEMRKVND